MQWPRATPLVAGVVDAALAVGFSALTLAETVLHWDDGYSAGSDRLNIPLLLLITLPLALRRRAPWAALVIAFGSVVLPSLVVAHTLFFFGGLLPLAILVYSAARSVDRAGWAVLLGPVLLAATYQIHMPRFEAADYVFVSGLFGLAWGLGRLVHRLEHQRAQLAEALAGALREREARERALLLDERARIACELHDVVAHAVSVMVVQAGAARFALGSDEDEVRDRLLSVEDTGRTAVADLRRLLDLLRADDDDEEIRGPHPGLAQLGRLVDELQRAGLPVRVEAEELPRDLPAAVDLTAYRLVQEALTNVLKHADPDRVVVRVQRTADAVVLEVVDSGPGRPESVTRLSSGHGLVGMRERVAVFGGRLDAGPDGAGWRVRAELPLSRAEAGAAR